MNLPLYKLTISEDENGKAEVSFVALVDKPAIQREFLMFKQDRAMFAVQNEDERIVSGPAMVPDLPIYRNEKGIGECFVVFDAETISGIALRFFQKGYQTNINEDHDRTEIVEGAAFFESWIVDREKGKQPLSGYEDMPDGTWFLTAKINNDDTWDKVKSGDLRGFSVEGLFNFSKVGQVENTDEATLLEEVRKIIESVEE